MKILLPVLLLVQAFSLFAMDEYLPIKEKTVEADIGYHYTTRTGYYNDDGEIYDLSDNPAVTVIPIQLKQGIIPGMDIELQIPFTIKNRYAFSGNRSTGIDRPEIGLKYVVPVIGAGGYVDFTLPTGAEDIVGKSPAMALTLGSIYGLITEKFNLLATVDYTFEFESKNEFKECNKVSILVKPEYKPIENLGIYSGFIFDMTGESTYMGQVFNDAGHLLTIQPGLNFAANKTVAFEAGVPVPLMGKNNYSTRSVFGNVYISLELHQ